MQSSSLTQVSCTAAWSSRFRLSCCTSPSEPSSFPFLSDRSFLLSLKSLASVLHPALLPAPSALSRNADTSIGMSAGICPNETGVKSLPSASLLSSHQLSSVSNMLDMFLFQLKKKKKVIYFLITKEYRIGGKK